MESCEREKTVIVEEQADTLIEKLFFEATSKINCGKILRETWLKDKNSYSRETATTILNFEHYSLHDYTHSKSILNSIAFLLGEKKLRLLSAGDLWLLLQVAYFHDIGMAVDNEYLYKLWKESRAFKAFFQESLLSNNIDIKTKAEYIRVIDELVLQEHNYSSDAVETPDFDKGWPITVKNVILSITTEYVRKHHGELAVDKMKKNIDERCEIDRRFYMVVAEISLLHTSNFQDIFKKVEKEDTFMGCCHIHPQFVAMLLRMGDLLDMDNNRFDYYILNHYGKLPKISKAHLNKHLSIWHLNITPYRITAEARPSDIDSCIATAEWFKWLEEENRNFIAYWNNVAPHELGGCTLSICNLKIMYDGEEFDAFSTNAMYEIDKKRAIRLLIGDNIYGSNLEFLREYVQNAIDANKMEFEKQRKDGLLDYLINEEMETIEPIMPFSFKTEAFAQFPIKIRIHIESTDMTEDMLVIEITDNGIGIEKNDLGALTTIGSGWNSRKSYHDKIEKLLFWLKPTAGFGIGIQAAFMVSDDVTFKTKAKQEAKGHIVTLRNPSKDGSIIRRNGTNLKDGTTVEIKVPLHKFMDHQMYTSLDVSEKNLYTPSLGEKEDMFLENDILNIIAKGLGSYLEKYIVGCFFPILIYKDKSLEDKIYSDYWYECIDGNDYVLRKYYIDQVESETYFYSFDKDYSNMYLIDTKKQVSVKITADPKQRARISYCYKGVFVSDEKINNSFVDVTINILDGDVKDTLKVNRREFIKQFPRKKVTQDALKPALKMYLDVLLKILHDDRDNIQILSRFINIVCATAVYIEEKSILDGSLQYLSELSKEEIEEVNTRSPYMYVNTVCAEVDSNNIINYSVNSVSFLFSLIWETLINNDVIFCENYISVSERVSIPVDQEQKLVDMIKEGHKIVLHVSSLIMKVLEGIFGKDVYLIKYGNRTYRVFGIKVISPEISKKKIDFKEIAKQSGRTIINNPADYEILHVNKIPYKENENKSSMLIMPIDALLKERITDCINQKIPFDEFKEIFTHMDSGNKDYAIAKSFQRLVDWVYNNQYEPNKYDKKEITFEYLRLLKDYYDSRIKESRNN